VSTNECGGRRVSGTDRFEPAAVDRLRAYDVSR